jgi:type II secretory ATPase GspE/PulE/Tfp pilus assembly ATPase PilB-like protein
VLGYIERLRVQKVHPGSRVYSASIDEITAAYAAHRAQGGLRVVGEQANSDEQRQIVEYMDEALKDDASDLHFIVGRDNCDIRFRILGELTTRHGTTRDSGMRLMSALYGSMCDVAQQTFNPGASQDARLNAKYTETLGMYGARVATRPTHDGLLMVLRLLKSDSRILTRSELGFLPQQDALFEEMSARPYGVNLITGPTGSGKSRTLQATMTSIVERDQGRSHVITVEDPPEYPIPGAVVTPLRVKDRGDPAAVSRAWRESISNAMRLDPDVIMVGEVRDLDSANMAFAAAMTGHGVWGTLHANDATSAAERLIDINVERAKVTDPTLLVGLSAQRLVPVLCAHCKIALKMGKGRLPPSTYARLVSVSPPDQLDRVYVRGDGCSKCRKRGIAARHPVVEAIVPTVPFMEEFRASASDGKLRARRYWVDHMNGITMLRHALHLVWQGMVDPLSVEKIVAPLDNDFHLLGMNYATARQLV